MSSVAKTLQARGRAHARASFHRSPLFGRDALAKDPWAMFFSSHYAYHRDYFEPRTNEFLFTWIRHPVDQFYSGCEFYRQEGRPLQTFWPQSVRRELTQLHRAPTIEAYIDNMLTEPAIAPEWPCHYWRDDWGRYSFIGLCERHEDSLRRLGELLSDLWGVTVDLPAVRVNVTSQSPRPRPKADKQWRRGYRREDLELFFSREIEEYRRLAGYIARRWLDAENSAEVAK